MSFGINKCTTMIMKPEDLTFHLESTYIYLSIPPFSNELSLKPIITKEKA
ncbi:hypothetical protein H8356DRAFT_1338240 [Neocallimastix lanati (nom. inval.)]|nr:hypothetical protein H8356DRAFT_1338240 [Neocallimastix sp. JGI-2020a]